MVPKAVRDLGAQGQHGIQKETGDENGRGKNDGQNNKVFSVVQELSLIRRASPLLSPQGEYVCIPFRKLSS